jgi:hypothetical protein
VICSYQLDDRDPLTPVDSAIPPLLFELLSPITEKRFEELSHDTSFLYRTVSLCEQCAKLINSRIPTNNDKSSPTPPVELVSILAPTPPTQPAWISVHSRHRGCPDENVLLHGIHAKRKLRSAATTAPCTSTSPTPIDDGNARLPSAQSPSSIVLPELVPQEISTTEKQEISRCLEQFADHLLSVFGKPSVRLALSRTGVSPSTSLILLDSLQSGCEVQLLNQVRAYVSATLVIDAFTTTNPVNPCSGR